MTLSERLAYDKVLNLSKKAAEELCKELGIKHTPDSPLKTLQAKLFSHREQEVIRSVKAEMKQESDELKQMVKAVVKRMEALESSLQTGKALQPPVVALDREVPLHSSYAQAVTNTAAAFPSLESAVSEVQQREARKEQLCISNLPVQPDETPDNFQEQVESFIGLELGISSDKLQLSSAKRMAAKQSRPGIVILTCSSAAQRLAILKAANRLKGRNIYIHPNFTKLQAQRQYELRQQRRDALSKGVRMYIRGDQLMPVRTTNTQPPSPPDNGLTQSPLPPSAAAAATPAATITPTHQ